MDDKFILLLSLSIFIGCVNCQQFPDEKFISNVKQLTFGGHHTLPSFSYDGNFVVFSAHGGPYGIDCDQVFRINLKDLTELPARVSPGIGYATNARFAPNSHDITFESNFHKVNNYAGNFAASQSCPVSICQQAILNDTIHQLCSKQTWPLYPNTEVFYFNQYGNIKDQLTLSQTGGYNGEGWIANATFDGQMFYFISKDNEGMNYYVKQLGQEVTPTLLTAGNSSYYGGLSIDHDSRRVTFHGHRPQKVPDQIALMAYLKNNIVPVENLQIFHAAFDGFEVQHLDRLEKFTSFYPVFANTAGNKIVLSTNYGQPNANNYGLYLYNVFDFTLLPVSTLKSTFSTIHGDVSYDYNKIVFTSNRNSTNPAEFQLFIADFNVTGSSNSSFDGGHFQQQQQQQISSEPETAAQCWQDTPTNNYYDGVLHFPGEVHFKNVKQLTFGGENAEGYFSFDDNKLTLQATGLNNYGTGCDQIYQLDLCKDPAQQIPHKMSTGLGVTTCSYFFKDNRQSLYAGTFKNVFINSSIPHEATCPIKSCNSANPLLQTNATLAGLCKNASYVWDIYPDFDIFLVNEYGIITKQLTDSPGYDAEGVISPDGSMIAFTSTRNGDLDLYIMNTDGSNVRQITNTLGYDGGSFFSPDNKRLIFRASRPKAGPEADYYKLLLSYNIVVPLNMELFVVNVDGSNMRQITHLGAANWAPYYLADNKRVIFSSDFNATAGFGAFDLYIINDDGTGLERVTWDDGQFDAFPMMNHAGTKLVWGSSRNGSTYDLNLFIADWVDPNTPATNPTSQKPPTTTSSAAVFAPLWTVLFAVVFIFFKMF